MVVDIPRLKNLKILFLIQGVGGGTVFQKKELSKWYSGTKG